MELDIKVRVWLLEYKSMLERQAKETNIPLIARKNMEKAKEISDFLNNKY